MYYLKIENLHNCIYIRLDLPNGKTDIIARVIFHDYNSDKEAIEQAEKIVNLLNQ